MTLSKLLFIMCNLILVFIVYTNASGKYNSDLLNKLETIGIVFSSTIRSEVVVVTCNNTNRGRIRMSFLGS